MRKLIYISLVVIISAGACSKKNETTVKTPANTVSIGSVNYNTVVIGTQTWTATNYNGPGAIGGFYTIAQATAINLPAGWRLPTQNDFTNLLKSAGATLGNYYDDANPLELMSITGWSVVNGTNSLGFNAMPLGFAVSPGPTYINSGTNAVFWSSSLLVPGEPIVLIINIPSNPGDVYLDKLITSDYASIRFVKDN